MTGRMGFFATAGSAAPAGWTLVGQTSQAWADTSTTKAISLTGLTGGIASAPAEGDVVVVLYGISIGGGDIALGISTGGYTTAELWADTPSVDQNGLIGVKRMGATPDTSVTVTTGYAAATTGQIAVVQVWRGGDPSTTLDVSIVTATGTGVGRPDPGSITPATSGALIIAGGLAGAFNGWGMSAFTSGDLSNFFQASSAGSSLETRGALGTYEWSSGAFDPAAWGGGTANSGAGWTAFTLALRPA